MSFIDFHRFSMIFNDFHAGLAELAGGLGWLGGLEIPEKFKKKKSKIKIDTAAWEYRNRAALYSDLDLVVVLVLEVGERIYHLCKKKTR